MQVPVLKTDRDSFWHRRDPRVKVVLFMCLIVLIYVAPSWTWMAGLVGIGIALAVTSRAPWKWLIVLLLIQVPNVIGLVLIPGWEALSKGEFDADFEFGLRMALGWIAAVLIGVSLISTMEIDEIVEGLRGVGLPRRFAFTVGYTFVLVYLSANDILRITEAAKLKGVELTLRRPLRFIFDVNRLMVPALFTTVRRGSAMTAALDMRGFSARRADVRRVRLKFDGADAAALACGLAIVIYAGAIRADFVEPLHPLLDKTALNAGISKSSA